VTNITNVLPATLPARFQSLLLFQNPTSFFVPADFSFTSFDTSWPAKPCYLIAEIGAVGLDTSSLVEEKLI
jgi:hypothetical protein